MRLSIKMLIGSEGSKRVGFRPSFVDSEIKAQPGKTTFDKNGIG